MIVRNASVVQFSTTRQFRTQVQETTTPSNQKDINLLFWLENCICRMRLLALDLSTTFRAHSWIEARYFHNRNEKEVTGLCFRLPKADWQIMHQLSLQLVSSLHVNISIFRGRRHDDSQGRQENRSFRCTSSDSPAN